MYCLILNHVQNEQDQVDEARGHHTFQGIRYNFAPIRYTTTNNPAARSPHSHSFDNGFPIDPSNRMSYKNAILANEAAAKAKEKPTTTAAPPASATSAATNKENTESVAAEKMFLNLNLEDQQQQLQQQMQLNQQQVSFSNS